MKQVNQLEVGNVLWIFNGINYHRYIIHRVTAKTAYSAHLKIKRQPNANGLYDGINFYGMFSKETPELIRKIEQREHRLKMAAERSEIYNYCRDNLTSLTDEQLKKLAKIISKSK